VSVSVWLLAVQISVNLLTKCAVDAYIQVYAEIRGSREPAFTGSDKGPAEGIWAADIWQIHRRAVPGNSGQVFDFGGEQRKGPVSHQVLHAVQGNLCLQLHV